MTRLTVLVALTAIAIASLVEADGSIMDLLKGSIKRHKSPYSPYSQGSYYGGSSTHGSHHSSPYASPYESRGPSHYDSAYSGHSADLYDDSGYELESDHQQYGYGPYSEPSHNSRYRNYPTRHSGDRYHSGYLDAELDYSPSHIPPPVYSGGSSYGSGHGAGHLYGSHYGGVQSHHNPIHVNGRHYSAKGSGGSSAASSAGGAGAAAAAAAGAGGSSAAASVRGGVHNEGTKYGHLNSGSMQHAGMRLPINSQVNIGGLHYDTRGAHSRGHPSPYAQVGLDFELGHHGHQSHKNDLAYGAESYHQQASGLVDESVNELVNEPQVYHNTELLPDGHKTSTFVNYQEKPIEETMASSSGTFSTDDQGIERSSYTRSTEHLQNKEDGHIDDDHYYQAQSYGKTHDDHLHEASNRDDEDYEVTPTGYRKKKRKGNYVKSHTKTTRETGSGVLAKDRHQAGFTKSVNKLVENVNKNKVSNINGVAHDENLSSSQDIDDGDEDFYDSDLAKRGHNIPGPQVPRGSSVASSAAAGTSGSAVASPGPGASAASAAGPGGVSSSAQAGRK